KGVLGEGLHQINLIYPVGLERNAETSTAIKEAKTRGATRDNIALLGAVANKVIWVNQPNEHGYTVTPSALGTDTTPAITSTPQATAASATTLGAYAYRHCFRAEPPALFTGAAREATERVAQAMLETNPRLRASEDILSTPIPAGTVISLPGTTTTYRYNPRQAEAEAAQSRGERITGVVRVRLNTQGCFGLSAPAIQGEQCMDKPGAVVKCVPKARQSQCSNVYQEGEGVKGCQENNVCCEVLLAQAGEHCVIPEKGAFLSSGAKCKARCRNEVSPADYGKIDVERVGHCAEGLSCCKATRASTTQEGATVAAAKNDNKCTEQPPTGIGGICSDIRNNDCIDIDTGAVKPFVAGKCLSNKASWYQCCPGGISPKETVQPEPAAGVRDDSACTSAGGICGDITRHACGKIVTIEGKEYVEHVPFVPGKCLSERDSWYQCCPTGSLWT
ncbi:MAG: hypothetical protein QME12_04640, partial [Nanoarchaeota archaeon]|nr:hypothetical protein [Nanoarchaeota archaeon]